MPTHRILARPIGDPVDLVGPGVHDLADVAPSWSRWSRGQALLSVPERRASPAPLLVFLHGAGAHGEGALALIADEAAAAGIVVLAPSSAGATWDAIRGRDEGDVERLDGALAAVFERVDVDPSRIGIGGFSDGASYALTLGIDDGELFRAVVAFSPGFATPHNPVGQPRIWVSHGTDDPVLPIDRCSRRLVDSLRRAEYDVTYREFRGGHIVPHELAASAMAWFVDR